MKRSTERTFVIVCVLVFRAIAIGVVAWINEPGEKMQAVMALIALLIMWDILESNLILREKAGK